MPVKEKKLSALEQKLNDLVETYLKRIPFAQKLMVFHHLQVMIGAGLSIVAALKILSEEIENKKLRKIVGVVKTEVEKGKQLSEALSAYPRVFSPLYVGMIAAGETAGQLEQSLKNAYTQMHKSQELARKVRGAMIYPIVIFVAMGGVAVEVVFFVLPKIMVMFTEFNAQLPLSTRILIAITKFGQNYGPYIILVLVATAIAFSMAMRRENFRRHIDSLILHLPIFGNIVKKVNLARFTMTLSSLLQSSIPIIDAMHTAAESQGNLIYRDTLLAAVERIKKGEALSIILSHSPKIFPPMVTEMIMVGEESGQVEKMLLEMSDYYTDEVDDIMNNFSKIIEPVVILILGLATAGIAVAVIMPMYSLAQSF